MEPIGVQDSISSRIWDVIIVMSLILEITMEMLMLQIAICNFVVPCKYMQHVLLRH